MYCQFFANVEEMSDNTKPKHSISACIEGNVMGFIYVGKLEIHTVLAYHCTVLL